MLARERRITNPDIKFISKVKLKGTDHGCRRQSHVRLGIVIKPFSGAENVSANHLALWLDTYENFMIVNSVQLTSSVCVLGLNQRVPWHDDHSDFTVGDISS